MTRDRTETSRFGVSRRQSHDARRYYERALATADITTDSTVNRVPPNVLDRLFCASSTDMSCLPDDSVALMVTSPSYHVGKDYDLDTPFVDYLDVLRSVFAETYRVLEPGGRAAINVANLGRKPYVHFSDVVAEMCKDIGFLPRGEVIWVKGKGASGNMAVGSYLKPSNPVIRDVHEYILVFSKGRFDRAQHWKQRRDAGLPWVATITKDDFFEATLSVWYVRPESAKRVGHPAPFPIEIPRRFIELYTYAGDVVLDPMIGSGTTAAAARTAGRRYVGFDTNPAYIARAEQRIAALREDNE